MRLLIMGAPGSGKGVQASLLSARLAIPAISTGDIFRAHVRDSTPLGLQVHDIMTAGDYVPDSITNYMVRERLAAPDARSGFILDGYPRTHDQVTKLDLMLTEGIDSVIHLVVPPETLIPRLLERGISDGRSDDTSDAIARRLAVYDDLTEPILAIYRERGLAVEVDGLGTVDEVCDRIVAALSQSA